MSENKEKSIKTNKIYLPEREMKWNRSEVKITIIVHASKTTALKKNAQSDRLTQNK